MADRDLEERIAERYTIEQDGCWHWNGACSQNTGPVISYQGRKLLVSRWLYAQTHGDIPEGRVLFVTCRNTRCVNPDHHHVGLPGEFARREMLARDPERLVKREAFRAWLALPKELRQPLTQTALAQELGVSSSVLTRWKDEGIQVEANSLAWRDLHDYLPDVLRAIGEHASAGSIKHINLYLAMMGRGNAVAASNATATVHLHPERPEPEYLSSNRSVVEMLNASVVPSMEESE